MVTTRLEIKKHLEEYVKSKYFDIDKGAVVLPDELDLYHVLWDLMEPRRSDSPPDTGTLIIALPDRRIGKNPECYNYLGERSQRIFEKKVEVLFWAELHELIDHNRHVCDIEHSESIYVFMKKHDIISISEDALKKNYYRWREKLRKKSKRRNYNKS